MGKLACRLGVCRPVLASVLMFCPVKLIADENPFDPSAFIQSAETQKNGGSGITSMGIYRINGNRFFQFTAVDGEVFLPAIGDRAEIREDAILCRPHLRLKREALMIRDKMPLEQWVRDSEAKIFAMILKCIEGEIAGPTKIIEAKDGADIEIKSKKPTKSHETKIDRN